MSWTSVVYAWYWRKRPRDFLYQFEDWLKECCRRGNSIDREVRELKEAKTLFPPLMRSVIEGCFVSGQKDRMPNKGGRLLSIGSTDIWRKSYCTQERNNIELVTLIRKGKRKAATRRGGVWNLVTLFAAMEILCEIKRELVILDHKSIFLNKPFLSMSYRSFLFPIYQGKAVGDNLRLKWRGEAWHTQEGITSRNTRVQYSTVHSVETTNPLNLTNVCQCVGECLH